ncbi:helix-turn-helix domain-containing protein [Microbacterium sp. Marseille-Q6965]|uniref:helix-turn-helix domain-containing protein n=1 Tax=Microbacterium sp. Marseille-Q6965 TaxID=2965072 RepID=UPI0021B71F76|nr:helix-turn-helix transcriptional regulator [Microbacterium sp. Marseille-Q6965]
MGAPHSPAAKKVGLRVAELRHRAGLSAKALAECADLDLTHLQRVERGQANPTLMTLVQIAIALEVDPGSLVEGIGADELQEGRLPYGHSQRTMRRRRSFAAEA